MIIKFEPIEERSNWSHNAFFIDRSIGYEETKIGFADYGFTDYAKYHVDFDLKAISKLSKFSIKDIFNCNISSFTLKIDLKKFKYLDWGTEESDLWFDNDGTCYLNMMPDLLQWNKPLNLITFLNRLDENLSKNDKINFVRNQHLIEEGFGFKMEMDVSQGIDFIYDSVLYQINKENELIFQEFENINHKDSLVSVFSFPPEVQSSCEQYLIYFSQFMKDLGVNVSSDIRVEAKKTLFTVTPEDKTQALTQIRDALNIFLELAEIQDIESYSSGFNDIGVKQLISNIYHLKSQLVLANSAIQMKDATIESLKFTNYQKTTLIELNSKNKSNEEKALDGLVTINELKGKGFKINLPEIFRRIKRRFK